MDQPDRSEGAVTVAGKPNDRSKGGARLTVTVSTTVVERLHEVVDCEFGTSGLVDLVLFGNWYVEDVAEA